MVTLARRLSGIPAGTARIPMEKVSAFCADRLRRMARSAEFNTPEDPPIVAADLLARRGRAKRGKLRAFIEAIEPPGPHAVMVRRDGTA